MGVEPGGPRGARGPGDLGPLGKVKELLWGLFLFDYWKEMVATQRKYEDAITLFLFGEFMGLPFMQSVFTLRLLPFVVPEIEGWKLRSLREYDILQAAPDIH